MLKTILLASGYPPATLIALQKQWHVINIPNQEEALHYLQSATELPDAICIGNVTPGSRKPPFARGVLAEIQKINPHVPVIISTSQSAAETIVDLVKRGAFDYVVEPIDKTDHPLIEAYTQGLILALTRAIQWHSLVQENQQLRNQQLTQNIPGTTQLRSPPMLEVMYLVEKVAPTTATVLITGPSGTGKEVIARTIHERSSHHDEPFTAINCGALSQTLLTSELFGHVKGAFTGADHDRQGILQQAGHGTLFLDEIGTVTPAFQVMLLRILEQRVARPVGSQQEYPVHCRFIAAANQDLAQKVREGYFREDFYYRLNLFHINLQPLYKRPSDIPILVHHFLCEVAEQYQKPIIGIDPAAMTMLEAHTWPGNVRELRNAIERAVILCENNRLSLSDFNIHGDSPRPQAASPIPPSNALQSPPVHYQQAMHQFENHLLNNALAQAQGNLSQAARQLQMNRTTLHYRLKQLSHLRHPPQAQTPQLWTVVAH